MNKKVERIVGEIEKAVTAWPGIDSLVLMENENDANDLYFFLSFDAYFSGDLPNAEQRQASLYRAGAFETNRIGLKDRFLLEDIAVRIEYKNIAHFGTIDPLGSTYALHRLTSGRVVFSRSDSLQTLRLAINNLSDDFWHRRRQDSQARLEHCLTDLEAARIHDDRLFYTISLAGFLVALCSTLFALNRRLEPNHRLINRELMDLQILPESFNGSLDILLRFGELPLERHCEIASRLTRQIIAL